MTVLDNTVSALETLLAVWLSGRVLVSLPIPGRAENIPAYIKYLHRVKSALPETVAVLPEPLSSLMREASVGNEMVDPASADEVNGTPVSLPGGAGLVQFSSGSLAEPKGVYLSLSQLLCNIDAILARVPPDPLATVYSWLPLSHDMGLIGMLLAGLVGTSPRWAGSGQVWIAEPSSFVRDPRSWFRALSDLRAQYTGGPNFALELSTRLNRRESTLDLSALRHCFVGGEIVRQSTLSQAYAKFSDANLTSPALMPSYGLAEASLAVAVNHEFYCDDGLHGRENGPVSCGRPLDGVTIDCAGGRDSPQPIYISGASVTGLTVHAAADPSFRLHTMIDTGDIGFVEDSELYVVGRHDSVVNVYGKLLALTDVDAALDACHVLRPGGGFAIPVADHSQFDCVVELGANSSSDAVNLISQAVYSAVSIRPRRVIVVQRGRIPKTSSGKVRRNELARRVADLEEGT